MPSSFCRRQLSTRCALTLTPCLRLALPSPPPPLQPPPPALVPLRAARCFPPPAQDEVKEFFGDPYSMQMYGIVFGYLSIARMTVSYQRYWEGVTHVKTMHAKWMESFSQVIVFDRIDEPHSDLTQEAYCLHMVKLYTQISALAIMRLHLENGDGFEHNPLKSAPSEVVGGGGVGGVGGKGGGGGGGGGAGGGGGVGGDGGGGGGGVGGGGGGGGEGGGGGGGGGGEGGGGRGGGGGDANGRTPKPKLDGTPTRRELLQGVFSDPELEMLRQTPCPVSYTANRISRAISTRARSRGWRTPAPVFQQVWNQLTLGTLSYHQATKIKEVPMPFAYVQFNALLLNFFILLTPLSIACFTTSVTMSIITSCIVVGGFSGIWMVANELEDPFGSDANDLPMYEYHEQFCAEIRAVLTLQPQDDFTCMESGHSYRGPAPARGTGARPTISVGGGTCARDSKWRHLTMPTSLQVTLTLTLTLTLTQP
jgi:predicted membrane chloride channel (bestrophin family)